MHKVSKNCEFFAHIIFKKNNALICVHFSLSIVSKILYNNWKDGNFFNYIKLEFEYMFVILCKTFILDEIE